MRRLVFAGLLLAAGSACAQPNAHFLKIGSLLGDLQQIDVGSVNIKKENAQFCLDYLSYAAGYASTISDFALAPIGYEEFNAIQDVGGVLNGALINCRNNISNEEYELLRVKTRQLKEEIKQAKIEFEGGK